MEPIPGPGDHRRTLSLDGLERVYHVHVPPDYDPTRPPAVVLAFHGTPSDAAEMRRITGFDDLADRRGFVAVYPEAATGDWATGCLACPSAADRARIDDVGFVRRLIADLDAALPINRGRVFAAGFSNGALFADRLACAAADLLAGSAIVAATLLEARFTPPCRPARAIRVVLIHGDADPTFPPDGRAFGPAPEDPRTTSIAATLESWGARAGCDALTAPDSLPDLAEDGTRVFERSWTGCDRGVTVRFYGVDGGGHTWPGSPVEFGRQLGPKSRDLDASAAIADFFLDR